MKDKKQFFTLGFLLAELVLYILILTTGGDVLVWSSFGAIVLCFAYGLLCHGVSLLVAGLGCTVAADFFLVVCSPIQQLYGMICFLAVQTLYAVFLLRGGVNRVRLGARLGLMVGIVAVAVVILKDKTDALALVSVCYYVNLIMNMVEAFAEFRKFRLLAMGLVLFILCDTVIGLQVASGGYLPIGEETLLHRILFVDFNLSWFFYLPSQVLIALTAANRKQKRVPRFS